MSKIIKMFEKQNMCAKLWVLPHFFRPDKIVFGLLVTNGIVKAAFKKTLWLSNGCETAFKNFAKTKIAYRY